MSRNSIFCLLLLTQIGFASSSIPTVHDVYQMAETGNLAKAHQMIETVLQAHPESAKAHYVDAEILTKEGNYAQAQEELTAAKKIDPTLSFASKHSIQELEKKLGETKSLTENSSNTLGQNNEQPMSLGLIIAIAGGVILLLLVLRMIKNRNRIQPYNTNPNSTNNSASNPYGTPTGGYPNQPQSSGLGSSIASGLAGGAAAGVGFVAAEELMHHFMNENNNSHDFNQESDGYSSQNDTYDMGGNNFGIDDSSSWDDNESGDDSW